MKYFWIVLLCCLTGTQAMAQDTYSSTGGKGYHYQKKSGFDPSRLVYSGGLGLTFGDYTDIGIFPMIGYRITDHFAAGVGIGYEYLRIKDHDEAQTTDSLGNVLTDQLYPLQAHIISPSIWARYKLTSNIFASVQYEEEFQTVKEWGEGFSYTTLGTYPKQYSSTQKVPVLLVGGGYCQPVGANVSLTISGMYDVVQNPASPYYKTIYFSTGFIIGF